MWIAAIGGSVPSTRLGTFVCPFVLSAMTWSQLIPDLTSPPGAVAARRVRVRHADRDPHPPRDRTFPGDRDELPRRRVDTHREGGQAAGDVRDLVGRGRHNDREVGPLLPPPADRGPPAVLRRLRAEWRQRDRRPGRITRRLP